MYIFKYNFILNKNLHKKKFVSGFSCRFCKARNTCCSRVESFLETCKDGVPVTSIFIGWEGCGSNGKVDEISKCECDTMECAQTEAIGNGYELLAWDEAG